MVDCKMKKRFPKGFCSEFIYEGHDKVSKLLLLLFNLSDRCSRDQYKNIKFYLLNIRLQKDNME